MKNRKREICTSGSVRDEAGQPPHLLGRRPVSLGFIERSRARTKSVSIYEPFLTSPQELFRARGLNLRVTLGGEQLC